MPRLETVYRQMREAADAGTDLTEGLEELNEVHGRRADKVAGGEKAPMKIKTKDALKGNKEGEDLGKAVVSPDEKDSGPSKSADKMKGGLTPAGKRRGDKKQGEVKGDYIKKIGINAGDHEDEDAISEDELEELDDLLDEIKDDDEDDDDEMKDDEDDEYDDEDKKKMKKEKFDFSKLKKNGDKDKDEDSDEDDEDHDEDDEDDDKDKKEAVLTKNDMIEAIKSKMIGMRKGKVSAAYESFLIQLEELDADISVEESARRFADSVEVDVTQDVEALLHGENISEDFKKKATTIFEAAVRDKVETEIAKFETKFNDAVKEEVEGIHDKLYTQVDEYVTYCAEEWLKENELAVETGLRTEITEEFMEGLKDLFVEKYIEIPEDRIDVIAELSDKNEELENSLKEELQRNIDLKRKISESTKEEIFAENTEGLADTQIEKLQSLAEGVSYDSEDDYREAIETLRENYFPTKSKVKEDDSETSVLVEDKESLAEELNKPAGMMGAVHDALSRTLSKK